MNTKTKEVNNELQPRVYVADLAAYNSGYLHGEWLDPTQEKETLLEAINKMLAESPIHELYPDQAVEEFAIHDYDDFYEADLGEYPNLDELIETACFISEFGRLGAALIGYCDSLQEAKKAIEDHYCGEFTSVEEYAYDSLNQTINIPDELTSYIDYKAYARDLELSGDIFSIKLSYQEVHIFWSF